MKKLFVLLTILAVALSLVACSSEETEEMTTLTVGATSVPHAEILEQCKPILAEQGIELEIVVFSDYNAPNKALDNGSLDANFYQHIPYMEEQNEEFGYNLVSAGGVHIEPIGIYSQEYDSLEELPDGATILMSNSVSDQARVLGIFEEAGLITYKEGTDPLTATIEDIDENPKNLVFDASYNPELLPSIYESGEGDAVAINSNFALGAGLNPVEDAIALESEDSPYVNVIAVNEGDEDSEEIQALVDALHSEEIQEWILAEYGGAVVPVSE